MWMTSSQLGIIRKKIIETKQFLHKEFTIKDLGRVDFFLGIKLQYTEKGMKKGSLCLKKRYILDILSEANILEANHCNTPYLIGCIY